MPIVPNFIERLVFLGLNQGPGPMLDLWGAVAFRAALAAVRLGVFDALDRRPMGVGELARKLEADQHGLDALLQYLERLGYVRRREAQYANTAMTAKWLTSASPTNMAPGLKYWGALLAEQWSGLEESLRTGQSANLYGWIEQQPEVSRDFQTWMIALARLAGEEIVAKLSLPAAAARLLDVGGGHGMYSILFCRRHPQLTATVFDSPQALASARENIAAEKMEGRVTIQAGDFLNDELGSGYDVALLFNIVHGLTPEQNAELLRRAAGALNPGGLAIVAEQLAGDAPLPIARTLNAMFRLAYWHLIGGGLYAFDEIAGWFNGAGFTDVRRINLMKAPGTSLVTGRKA